MSYFSNTAFAHSRFSSLVSFSLHSLSSSRAPSGICPQNCPCADATGTSATVRTPNRESDTNLSSLFIEYGWERIKVSVTVLKTSEVCDSYKKDHDQHDFHDKQDLR